MRVDFYILATEHPSQILQWVSKLVEKIYRAEHQLLILCRDPAQLTALDKTLWDCHADAFLPHGSNTDRIRLSTVQNDPSDICLNLSQSIPPHPCQRIADVVPVNEKNAARGRYKHYQQLKAELHLHDLSKDKHHG